MFREVSHFASLTPYSNMQLWVLIIPEDYKAGITPQVGTLRSLELSGALVIQPHVTDVMSVTCLLQCHVTAT